MARTVLVADDSPTIQKRAQGILKGEGFEVETVSNGVAAIKKLSKIQPVVVLADVSMPGRDGYEVCEFVKNTEGLRHVPVLLIASDLEPYDEVRGAQVRADGKIKKPFVPPEDLISAVTKFAAQAEAAAPRPETAETVITVPPPEAVLVAPIEAALEMGPPLGDRDLSAFSEGIAFAEPALEEMPVLAPEQVPPEVPPPEPVMEVEMAPAPEPAHEEIPAPPPEQLPPEPVPPEPVMELPMAPAPEPAVESEAPPAEVPPSVEAPALEQTLITTEPVWVEEPAAPLPESPPIEAGEQTMMFRAPAQIAEPMFSDETVAAAGELEVPPASVEPGTPALAVPGAEVPSLAEVPADEAHIAPAESEVPPAAEPEPGEPAAAAPALLDWQLLYSIVHQVVVKMAPPALPPQVVEDLARILAEEVAADLSGESPQVQ